MKKTVLILVVTIIFCYFSSAQQLITTQNYIWRNVKIEGGGGFIPGIIYNESQKDLVYIRTDIGGAYRSTDGGNSWTQLMNWVSFEEWNLLGVESIATDPVEPNRLYLAVGTYVNDWTNMNGEILISRDYGETFDRVKLPFKLGANMPARNMGERLVIDPNKNNIIYLGTRGFGLWRSTDYGYSWSEVESFPNPGLYIEEQGHYYLGYPAGIAWIVFDKNSSNFGEPTKVIYVGVADANMTNNIYRSTDAGKTWHLIPGQPTGFLPQRAKLSYKTGMLYITYSNKQGPYNGDKGVVYRYNPKTGEWKNISPMKYDEVYFGYGGLGIDRSDTNSEYDTIVVASLSSWWPDAYIWRSTTSGESWRSIWEWAGYPNRNLYYDIDISAAPWLDFGNKNPQPPEVSPKLGWMIASLEIDPFDSNKMLYGTGATLYGCDDLTNWDKGLKINIKVKAIGVEETSVQRLISPPEGPHLFSALGDIAGFRHEDIDCAPVWTYTQPTWGTTTDIDFAQKMTNYIVRVGDVDRVWNPNTNRIGFSYDGGKNWFQASSEPPGVTGGGRVAVGCDGSVVLWSPKGSDGVYYTTNNGSSWAKCNGLPPECIIYADRENPDKFYAFKDGVFYYSNDRGKNFVRSQASGLPSNGTFKSVYGKEGHIWFVGENGMWRSTDGGVSFSKIIGVDRSDSIGFGKPKQDGGYPAIYTYAIIYGVRGIFRSDDEGNTWVKINDEKNQFGCANADITGDPRVYGRVYLATNGLGIKLGEIASETTTQVNVYMLDIIIAPQDNSGSVILEPQGGVYIAGTTVTLTAQAASGWVFSSWSGAISSTRNPVSIVMDSNKSVTANFVRSSYTLNVSVNPQGAGSVSLNPPGGVYQSGTQVQLTATANSGYVFDHWEGDLIGNEITKTILMDSNKTVTAVFVSSSLPEVPKVSISLRDNEIISDVINISVNIESVVGIQKVLLYLNGLCISTDTVSPYIFEFDSKNYPDGAYTIRVEVYDEYNRVVVKQVVVEINNTVPPNLITHSELKDVIILSPNNDGKNDKIILSSDVEELRIYSLKGKLIEKIKTNFDGRNLKKGVYLYIAKLKNGDTKKGKIVIEK